MIQLREIRDNPEHFINGTNNKFESVDIKKILDLDFKWRSLVQKSEKRKSTRNNINQQISDLKKNKKNTNTLIDKMKTLSKEIKNFDQEISSINNEINEILKWIPNPPHVSVPIGKDSSSNEIVKIWGEKPKFNFKPKNHIEIATQNNLINFAAGSKIAGSGFPLYTDQGAKLERSLINFMIEHNVNKGYKEMFIPFLALEKSLYGTGQLPKLEEDMYFVNKDNLYLIPTAEVPLTNIHREEILNIDDLPIKYTSYSPCFRREAGSYGKETRGLLRVHQFNKIEMVKFVHPNESYNELENLLKDAESILQTLGLHYRVLSLCSGDLSFAASKCYDIEVWSPSENDWLEVSSCSNFESFQAKRSQIKFKNNSNKIDYVHTLNGSGLATPRLMISLLETYQTRNGSINLPKSIQEYFGNNTIS
tara:strand:+ start:30873 stop:32135 length:1263 start_codon:yes stop_codon:yes gene_type:complete